MSIEAVIASSKHSRIEEISANNDQMIKQPVDS